MKQFNLKRSSILFAILLVVNFMIGCSSQSTQPGLIQPVNSLDVDASLNGVKTNYLEGLDENIVSKYRELESRLNITYFKFDQYVVDGSEEDKLSSNSEKLNSTDYVSKKIKLEGNCDEWGSDEYNFALGLKRANAVRKAIVAQGVDASRITMVSYGESNPVCSDKTQDCWAKNRRVDFKLLP
jgi:peptidoglycan-associated lipoprotein